MPAQVRNDLLQILRYSEVEILLRVHLAGKMYDGRGIIAQVASWVIIQHTCRPAPISSGFKQLGLWVGQVREDPVTGDARPTGMCADYGIRSPDKIRIQSNMPTTSSLRYLLKEKYAGNHEVE